MFVGNVFLCRFGLWGVNPCDTSCCTEPAVHGGL